VAWSGSSPERQQPGADPHVPRIASVNQMLIRSPSGPIYTVMRLYWPKTGAPLILPPGEGTWQPPAIVAANPDLAGPLAACRHRPLGAKTYIAALHSDPGASMTAQAPRQSVAVSS